MKLKKMFLGLPILLVVAVLMFTTGCKDDPPPSTGGNNDVPQYTDEDILGLWMTAPDADGDIEVLNFLENSISWFGFIWAGSEDVDWSTQDDTWTLHGTTVTVEDTEGFTIEYAINKVEDDLTLTCPIDGAVYLKVDGENGGGNGEEEYDMETMAGVFESPEAERIRVELDASGTAVIIKKELGNQPEEIDAHATWEIDNYERPLGAGGGEPLSIIITHTNSEFDQPYVLVINSVDELEDHWQITLTRTEGGNGNGNGNGNGEEGVEDDALVGLYFELVQPQYNMTLEFISANEVKIVEDGIYTDYEAYTFDGANLSGSIDEIAFNLNISNPDMWVITMNIPGEGTWTFNQAEPGSGDPEYSFQHFAGETFYSQGGDGYLEIYYNGEADFVQDYMYPEAILVINGRVEFDYEGHGDIYDAVLLFDYSSFTFAWEIISVSELKIIGTGTTFLRNW